MKFEAPKRRSCDRIAAVQSRRRAERFGTADPDPDSDPAAALLLQIAPARATASPTQFLVLAEAALGSPR